MSIRAERGEQRPRCDGGKVEWSGGGPSYSKLRLSKSNGKLVF